MLMHFDQLPIPSLPATTDNFSIKTNVLTNVVLFIYHKTNNLWKVSGYILYYSPEMTSHGLGLGLWLASLRVRVRLSYLSICLIWTCHVHMNMSFQERLFSNWISEPKWSVFIRKIIPIIYYLSLSWSTNHKNLFV